MITIASDKSAPKLSAIITLIAFHWRTQLMHDRHLDRDEDIYKMLLGTYFRNIWRPWQHLQALYLCLLIEAVACMAIAARLMICNFNATRQVKTSPLTSHVCWTFSVIIYEPFRTLLTSCYTYSFLKIRILTFTVNKFSFLSLTNSTLVTSWGG